MRRLWATAATAGAVLALALPVTSYASCVLLTAKQQEQRADVIFVGVALEGPTSTGTQRFRVVRYLKGTGPQTAAVATGVVALSDGSGSTTSVSPNVSAGEQWRIYAQKRPGSDVLETNVCDGSKLASAVPASSSGAGGEDRTGALLVVGTFLAVLALASLAFVVRRVLRRRTVVTG